MKKFTLLAIMLLLSAFAYQLKAQSSNLQNGASNFNQVINSEKAPGKMPQNMNSSKSFPWTLQFTHNIDSLAVGQAGIESDGTYFYCPVWNGDTIYKFNLSGALVEKFVISGVSYLRDLAYDGTYFYGGSASNTIYKMNFTTKTLVSTITAPSGVQARHIAYDPIHNGLWCGNWSTDIWLVSTTNGNVLDTIPALGNGVSGTYGSAFDTISPGGPYLWLFDQSGNGVNIYQVDVNSESLTGLVYDISNDMTLATGAMAGGLFIQPGLVSGTVTLGGLVQNNMIFGYDLASTVPDTVDIGVYEVLSPTDGYNKSNNETVKIVVKNYGTTAVSSYSVGYTVNNGAAVTQTVSTALASFDADTITFTTGANMSTQGVYNFKFFTVLTSDNDHANDTLSANIEHLSPTSTFPYTESFESGFGGWVQSSNDQQDWDLMSGSTPSSGTGPSGASDGTYYVYYETSSPVATGDSAILSMPFNVSALNAPYFVFDYNMNGSAMGSLHINIYDGTTTQYYVWSKTGNQGSAWHSDSINLSSYTSSSYLEIQFVGVRGTSYTSDIAVDNIKIYDTNPAVPTVPNLVITEINYNPPESGTDTLEFIEIYNNDSTPVNLGGLTFTQGVNYTFPAVTLNAGDYFVVAKDSAIVNNFFNISAYQWTSGGLSNGGEDICIETANGDTVDYVDYDDNSPWPTSPDGNGPSLTFCNLSLDNNNGANWTASTAFVGVNAAGDSIFATPGAGCGGSTPPSTGFKVLLVDDDNNGSQDSPAIDTALAHSGYTYSYMILSSSAPTYNDLKDYDMIIWSTSNDGTSLKLWDVSDTAANGPGAIKFSQGLQTYIDSAKGTVWIDGLDFMYDIYGSAPYTFNAGDFVYDVMGISKYAAQSHVDDTLGSYSGLEMAVKTAGNNLTNPDTLKWKWSSLWFADAFEITPAATPLYMMGPAGYDFAGKISMLYKGNVITSSLRIGSLGDGAGNYVQDDVDSLVYSMIVAVENGLPQANPSGDTIPPTVTNVIVTSGTSIDVQFSEPVGISGETTSNYTGVGTVSSAVRNAAGDVVTLTLAAALNDGASYTLTIDNVKDTANNTMTPQSFDLVWNASVANLVFSEIMYNDPGSDDSLEFFELYNAGLTTAHLGGYKLTQGVVFEFPAGTDLAPNDFIVVAKNVALINSTFGITGNLRLQWTSGGLKNSGEDICIQNSQGDTVAYVDYDDAAPWPVKADGDGYSMVFCNRNADNNDGANWQLASKFVTVYDGDSLFADPGEGCIAMGFKNPKQTSKFDIYPNPAHNTLYISTDGKEYMLSVFDMSGALVKEVKINSASNRLSLDKMNAGLYYIRLSDVKTGESSAKKLIIE